MISHRNLTANFEQLMPDYMFRTGGTLCPGAKPSGLWLPFTTTWD